MPEWLVKFCEVAAAPVCQCVTPKLRTCSPIGTVWKEPVEDSEHEDGPDSAYLDTQIGDVFAGRASTAQDMLHSPLN